MTRCFLIFWNVLRNTASLSLSPLDYLSSEDFSRQTACVQACDKHGKPLTAGPFLIRENTWMANYFTLRNVLPAYRRRHFHRIAIFWAILVKKQLYSCFRITFSAVIKKDRLSQTHCCLFILKHYTTQMDIPPLTWKFIKIIISNHQFQTCKHLFFCWTRG